MSTARTKSIDDIARENAALLDELEKAKAQIEALAKETRSKNAELERLKHKLEALLHRLYGRRSEKGHPGQLLLFEEEKAEEVLPPVEDVPDDESALETAKPKKRRKPRALKNRDLPRVRELLDVPEHEKTCGCGARKVVMGETSRDEYDYEPASVFIREIVRPKYVCSCCDEITTAELPPALIERGMPGPGLLAQIVTAKYADHLPLYRQEAIFARHGCELSRQTMCDWIGVVAHHLLAIVLAMRRELLKRAVIQADETHVMMQTNAASKGCVRAYLWLTTSPETDIVLYDFRVTRSQSVVEALLVDFEGEVLLADGYAGYNPSEKHGVKRAGCWAHARRKVRDGMASHPAEASELFVLIQMLYAIERRARDLGLDAAGRLDLRQKESKSVLVDLRARVDALNETVLPKSAFGEALQYLDSQWTYLIAFADDGRIPIDNNNSERGMKPVAVGRKNWLFAGSVEGGQNAATLYSIIETCKRNGVPPFEYLRDVLSRISTHPHRLIHELTPAGWKAAREAAKAAPALT
jgi:transposase